MNTEEINFCLEWKFKKICPEQYLKWNFAFVVRSKCILLFSVDSEMVDDTFQICSRKNRYGFSFIIDILFPNQVSSLNFTTDKIITKTCLLPSRLDAYINTNFLRMVIRKFVSLCTLTLLLLLLQTHKTGLLLHKIDSSKIRF